MDKEVDPAVLAFIDEKRLSGERRTPVDIIARMGVLEARDKALEHAWLAGGDNDKVIAAVWAEFVHIGEGGRWFCLESLNPQRPTARGGTRTAQQIQRAENRIALLKRSLDAGQGFRAVLQTNRMPIVDLEADKAAKVSTRVADEEPWHVATWDLGENVAVLVRGQQGWLPSKDEVLAARARSNLPAPAPVPTDRASADAMQAAAVEHLARHFAGYGYRTDNLAGQALGYDIEVSDKKGATLLKLAVRGAWAGMPGFRLTAEQRAVGEREPTWRLALVTDVLGPAPQHKLYKFAELGNAPGFEPPA